MIICVILTAALLLPVTAQADVIYEPFDSFYEAHRRECTYVGRSFTTNGPNGTVTLYTSPMDPGVEAEYSNDMALYVSYTYETADGVLWACCDNWDENVTGWAPMEYLELVYDGQSFAEDYGDQFVPVQSSLNSAELTGKKVYFREYPGSADCIEVEMSADYRPEFYESYTDASGREWGHCGYFMGIKSRWINLSDPTADYETLFPMPEVTVPAETEPAPTEIVGEIKPAGSSLMLMVTAAVAAVVVVTAVLLVVLKKKKA